MSHASQKARLLALLQSKPVVMLPEILHLSPRIASHTKRLSELKAEGWDIQCEKEPRIVKDWAGNVIGRELHTKYRLVGRKP